MRALVVGVLVAVGLGVGMGSAVAGGPTSALVTSPSEGWAAGVYNDEAAYTELQALLDQGEIVTGEIPYVDGKYYNVTWLVHDVSVWRTDQVLMDIPGGPVVVTTMRMGEGGESGEGTVTQRRVAKPVQVASLLGAIGDAESGEAAGGSAAPEGAAQGSTAQGGSVQGGSVEPVSQRTALPGRDVRWEWGIGGVLVGLLAAVVVVRIGAVRAERVRAGR